MMIMTKTFGAQNWKVKTQTWALEETKTEKKREKYVPVDGSVHGVTEHGEARGHGGEEALVLVLVLVIVGATHLRSLTLKPETPIRRRSEKKGLRSVRAREREREWR